MAKTKFLIVHESPKSWAVYKSKSPMKFATDLFFFLVLIFFFNAILWVFFWSFLKSHHSLFLAGWIVSSTCFSWAIMRLKDQGLTLLDQFKYSYCTSHNSEECAIKHQIKLAEKENFVPVVARINGD